MSTVMGRSCYEATATVVASAESLAAAHGYRALDVNWTEQHWDWRARLLMNAAYYRMCAEHCAEHGDEFGEREPSIEMLPKWRECETRMRALYEGGGS